MYLKIEQPTTKKKIRANSELCDDKGFRLFKLELTPNMLGMYQ